MLATLWLMLTLRSSGAVSGTAVTVTCCAVSQLPVVKVSAPDTVAAAVLPLAGVTVTSPVGALRSTTV